MIVVKWLWAINFLLFSLVLLFVWSKKVILAKRVVKLQELLRKTEEIERSTQKV